jgi:uncharacterized protein YcfL
MKCRPLQLVLIAPLLVLIGCASAGDNAQTPTISKSDKYAPQQVVFATADLADSISIGRIVRNVDPNTGLRVTVPLTATTDLAIKVDYRFTFFDDGRTVLDSPTPWQTATLTPHTESSLTSFSNNPKARDFQIELRWKQ